MKEILKKLDNLQEYELYSSEDNNGEILIDVNTYLHGNNEVPSPKLPINKDKVLREKDRLLKNPKISPELMIKLDEIYSEIGILSLGWQLASSEKIDKLLLNNEFLKKEYFDNNISLSVVREYLSGTINIIGLKEMFDHKKHYYLKGTHETYYPFDFHYETIVCFKEVNGIINNNLYLLNSQDSNSIIDMKIGCMEYFELAYQAKLIHNWQYAYVSKNNLNNEKVIKMLPVIFPFLAIKLSDFR